MIKALDMAKNLVKEFVKKTDIVVDATMGNGNDTVFLAGICDNVFAFDIQEIALQKTLAKLEKKGLSATLIFDGHENVDKHIDKPIRAAMFNLGYLPGGDETIITVPETTLVALDKMSNMLVPGGRIAIMVYSGHEGGADERNAVMDWARNLDKIKWQVLMYKHLNLGGNSPFLIVAEKTVKSLVVWHEDPLLSLDEFEEFFEM